MNGFHLAALTNIAGILLFSRGLVGSTLGQHFPGLFGFWGLVCIMLWGLAYLSVARSYAKVPSLVAVFGLEKLVYVASWVWWLMGSGSQLGAIFAQDALAGVFFAAYGAIDLAFAVYFLGVYRKLSR